MSPFNRAGHDLLNLLRHDPHIRCAINALVAETVDTDAVVETAEQSNVFFQVDVGTPTVGAAHTAPAEAATASANAAPVNMASVDVRHLTGSVTPIDVR